MDLEGPAHNPHSQICLIAISGQLFSCFFSSLTPLYTFDQDHLGLFCSPRVVQHISNQQKVWCHILKWIWKELLQ